MPIEPFDNEIQEILIDIGNYQFLMAQEVIKGGWKKWVVMLTRVG